MTYFIESVVPKNDKNSYVHICAGTETSFRGYELNTNSHYSGTLNEKGYPFQVKNKPSMDEGYLYFETLNMVFSLMDDQKSIREDFLTPLILLGNPSDCCALAAYRENSGYIVGVDPLASLVGMNIMHHLFCILNAIQRGKEHVLIFGHSRGAAAALLVAHDLDRLKQSEPHQSLYECLMKTPCQYTKSALKKITPSQKEWLTQYGQAILVRIKALRISMFLLDPVPGDGFLPRSLSLIGWNDERFKKIPAIVSQIEICYANHERTMLFRPICPKKEVDAVDTLYMETSLPGHHGTMIGNLNTHSNNAAMALNREHVQKIVLLKAIYLLKINGVPLNSLVPPAWVESDAAFKAVLLSLYDKVQENILYYNELKNHNMLVNYPFVANLFAEADSSGERCPSKSVSITKIEVSQPDANFVNKEHQALRTESSPTEAYPSNNPA